MNDNASNNTAEVGRRLLSHNARVDESMGSREVVSTSVCFYFPSRSSWIGKHSAGDQPSTLSEGMYGTTFMNKGIVGRSTPTRELAGFLKYIPKQTRVSTKC